MIYEKLYMKVLKSVFRENLHLQNAILNIFPKIVE